MMNPLRIGLLTTLLEMGADIDVLDRRARGRRGGRRPARARERAEGRRRAGGARALDDRRISDPGRRRRLRRAATTRMRGLHELRVKESDRLAAVAAGLAAAGVEHEIDGDDLVVEGGARRRAAGSSRPISTTASP